MRLHALMLITLAACDTDNQPRCEGWKAYDLEASGSDLGDLEGATVWISAVQPENNPHKDDVTVLLEATVEDGAFSASCDSSLSYNMIYPSAAVIIDANDDGVCSDGDQLVVWQYYGWDDDQVFSMDSGDLSTIDGDTTWGDRSVCEYYVPDDLL